MKSLVEHVNSLDTQELSAVLLEEIALCAAWYDSYHEDQEVLKAHEQLRQRLDLWVKCVQPPAYTGEGSRQQPILRMLIKDLVNDQADQLSPDDLSFLYFTWALAARTQRPELFKRPMSFIQPHIKRIQEQRKTERPLPGLPGLLERVGVFTPADLKAADPRDVRLFAGIKCPFRGPLLSHHGMTKVVGGVPEDTALVVEDGSCFVNGPVLGAVATTDSCEIAGNISGIVVARRGDVCGRALLNPCTVISKEGSVAAEQAQGPRLVFGCRGVSIKGDAAGGHYLGRKVKVGGKVVGGTIHASELLEASRFTCSEDRALNLVLRRGLSCADYGEVLNNEANVLLASAVKLRQRMMAVENMLDIVEREADEYAGAALLFLMGEADTGDAMAKIEHNRRRIGFLDRLDNAVKSLCVAAEERVNAPEEGSPWGTEDRNTVDDLRRELAQLANEGAFERDLHELREAVIDLGQKLQRRTIRREGVLQLLERLNEKGQFIRGERDALTDETAAMEQTIEKAVGRTALIERAKVQCSRAEMLEQLISAARKRGAGDTFYRKAQDRFVRILRRNIDSRLQQASGYVVLTHDLSDRIEKTKLRLWEQFNVSLPDHVLAGWSLSGVRATGCFGAGVRLLPWQHMLDGTGGREGVVVTEDTGGEAVSFVRSLGGTVEPAEDPVVPSEA